MSASRSQFTFLCVYFHITFFIEQWNENALRCILDLFQKLSIAC